MVTHTVAGMEVSRGTFREIKRRMEEAGYSHQTSRSRLDLSGIELLEGPPDDEEQAYLADMENAYMAGHNKSGVEPDARKGFKGWLSGYVRQWFHNKR